MTDTPAPNRLTTDLVGELLARALELSPKRAELLNTAAKRLDFLHTRLHEMDDEMRAKLSEPSVGVSREYLPSDHELRMQAMLAAQGSEDQVGIAQSLYRFLTEGAEIPARARYEIDMDAHDEHEDNARHLERTLGEAIGAASMAWSQTPRGVFDSTYAASIVQELVAYVRHHVNGMGDMLAGRALDEPGACIVSQDRIDAERSTWEAKGYTPEHDREHGGRQHLLTQAMIYGTQGRWVAALALLQAAGVTPPADEPEASA